MSLQRKQLSSEPAASIGGSRFAWWPVALLVLVIFGVSLIAWLAFLQVGSGIDTHRLKPEEIPALLEKRKFQES